MKLKFSWVLPLVLGASFSALASVAPMTSMNAANTPTSQDCDPASGNCSDYLSAVAGMFNNGAQPVTSAVMGWYVGRCYESSAPSQALASLLVGYETTLGGDNGPAFPIQEVMQAIPFIDKDGPANYFDSNLNQYESQVNSMIAQYKNGLSPIRVEHGSLLSVDSSTHTEWQIRDFKYYIVLKAVNLSDSSVLGYCYYFNKVK